ncbi:putative serine/threonine-protein kinase-like protein CCR3 [Mangifera indica]|uniref:putative serine/threonine-protein kinase-like protein CCR3 n=1 Tax=Mangifera indica TaxID=29780 RepID=UPI001CF95E6D|nr:putative serine/threonine-protein kinase-like protein CCR3 [Mangifera indica]
MTKLLTTSSSASVDAVTVTLISLILLSISSLPSLTHAIGSGSTIAVSYGSATVCAVVASQPTKRILCYNYGSLTTIRVEPNTSYYYISAGRNFFCAIRSNGFSLLCWDTTGYSSFVSKRIYYNHDVLLNNLAIGDDHVCATTTNGEVICWRGSVNNNCDNFPSQQEKFGEITSGFGFSCGILMNTSRVRCWGSNSIAKQIEHEFTNNSMLSIVAGASHVCGIDWNRSVICHGNNKTGQLSVPLHSSGYSSLALGENHSCGIRLNGSVDCWGGGGEYSVNEIEGISFESIVSGLNFTCGLTRSNFSVMCWGPGWSNRSTSGFFVPFGEEILPGPCVQSSCWECGIYPQSDILCSGSGSVCRSSTSCFNVGQSPPLIPPPGRTPSSPHSPRTSEELTRGLLVFAIVGSVGAFAGICTVIYCLWAGVCFGNKKIHNSVQPTITRAGSNGGAASNNSLPTSLPSLSSTIRRQSSRVLMMRRQRSGTSSTKHADSAEEFSFAELAAATNNFSLENKIGAGSFGVVYKGKLIDGREVAIKRGETGQMTKKFQEKESAFESELAFLSRLHHKHLVRLVGYCEEKEEKLLVYEYMKNGALYDHLHDRNNVEKSSSVINTWKMRIKIALDASRGIEYLHNYAVPPIIHRDIKSSNILIDAHWTGRVSDFGLSMMGPESDRDFRPMKAAGTVGYIDPEYYGLNVLTAKSDVYGLGVVLLELLTGKRAIFKTDENGGAPVSIVDFAVPAIMAGELVKILDKRVGLPELNEAEAVELVAYTAMHCVNLEGKERPTITDIVANLERALTLCEDSHGSISSGTNSIVSE